jgi:hypothetical protein
MREADERVSSATDLRRFMRRLQMESIPCCCAYQVYILGLRKTLARIDCNEVWSELFLRARDGMFGCRNWSASISVRKARDC